ncbi:MAG: Hpt domain-containing protein [Bdellovibrionales bacterium]
MSDEFLLELTADFVEQVTFALDECEEAFLCLETSTNPSHELTLIFRLAHSIKGGSAVLGLDDLSHFAHGVEDLLSILRTYPDAVKPEIVSVLLESVDKFKERITHIRDHQLHEVWDTAEVSEKVSELTKGLEARFGIASSSASKPSPALKESTDGAPVASISEIQKNEAVNSGPPKKDHQEEKSAIQKVKEVAARSKPAATSTVKVDTNRIDAVLDLVGELVVIKSQLVQEANEQPELK